jgi:hypothetical protein
VRDVADDRLNQLLLVLVKFRIVYRDVSPAVDNSTYRLCQGKISLVTIQRAVEMRVHRYPAAAELDLFRWRSQAQLEQLLHLE